MESYASLKEKEIMKFVYKWMYQEKIILSQVTQNQKYKCCLLPNSWFLGPILLMRICNTEQPQKPGFY